MSRIGLYNWALIAVVLAGALLSAGMGYLSQRNDAIGVQALSSDNTLWHTTALEREVFRFSHAVEVAMLGRPDLFPDAEDPAARFDILWSRVVTAQSGYIGRRLASIDEDGTVGFIARILQETEPQIMEFDPSATAANAALLGRLAQAQKRLTRLAALADRAEQRWTEQIQRGMAGSASFIKTTGFLALILCGLIVLAMRRQTRLDASRLQEIADQAQRAETAAKTRERFLTMVSHELRTPMNGVFGMTALLKTSRLDEGQKLYVHHALRSAHIMFLVVEALLDMSDIRDGKFKLETGKFSIGELARAIDSRLAPLRRAESAAIPVVLRGNRETLCTGDLTRIAQVVAQLAFHVVDALNAKHCNCIVEPRSGALQVSIQFDAQEMLSGSVAAVLNPEVNNARSLASDAAGPAVARELLQLMGAGRELIRSEKGSELRLTIPASGREGSADIAARPAPGPQALGPDSSHLRLAASGAGAR